MMDFTKIPFIEEKDYDYYNSPGVIYPGWRERFMYFCNETNEYLCTITNPHYLNLLEVKEKFGKLVIYWSLDDIVCNGDRRRIEHKISSLVANLEFATGFTCFQCGSPANLHSMGWVLPYCQTCANKHFEEKAKSGEAWTKYFRKLGD